MSKLTQSEVDALFAQYSAEESQNGSTPAPASFPQLKTHAGPEPLISSTQSGPHSLQDAPDLDLLAGIELEVTVRLGSTQRSVREVAGLRPGAVLELDNLAGEAVDVLVNGRLVARGEVVVVGEHYGVNLVEMIPPTDRALT